MVIRRGGVNMKTVYVVILKGCVVDAFSNADVDLVVLDLDTTDCEMLEQVEAEVKKVKADKNNHEIEIY
jgi:hypothetical protein